jgi:flagellum-specific ATP synthase
MMPGKKQPDTSYHFPRIDQNERPFTVADNGDQDQPTSDQDPWSEEQTVRSAEAETYQAGFEQGRDESLELEQKRIEPLIEMLGQAKSIIGEHQQDTTRQSGTQVVNLAVQLAGRIIRSEIKKRPELTGTIARKALAMVSGQGPVSVKAHPGDCGPIKAMLNDIMPESSTADHAPVVEVIPDHALVGGGCLVESDFGYIDARIDQQLASVSRALLKGCRRQAHGSTWPGKRLDRIDTISVCGNVNKVVGLVVEANGPVVQLGCLCDIFGKDDNQPIAAEVLGFRDHTVLLMPLEEMRSIGPGSRVVASQTNASVPVGHQLLGRVIDGLCHPIDDGGPLNTENCYPIYANPINPLLRQRIRTPLDLGIRAINGLLTVGCGQRMGIFAGSGVGKSVLMGMIARKSRADVNVIALIGERGRELNEFIDKQLGSEGLKRSVVVVATSDHLPLVRVRGAFVATAIAEYFRDQGLHVNLMMDSLTRFAMAQREIGLALGEPPTTKGYTPSVFTLLPRLLERTGTSDHTGTITGLYTVLVEGDDMNEPIADAARSILDGHIVLSRELAAHNHYPAIDVLRSISRVMEDIASLQHKHLAGRLKQMLSTYRKAEDLINIGAYVEGSNPAIDRAIAHIDAINTFLKQDVEESFSLEDSLLHLEQIMNTSE